MSLMFNVVKSTLYLSLLTILCGLTVKNLRKLRTLKTLVSSRWDHAGIQSLYKLLIKIFMCSEITNTGNWRCLKKLKPKKHSWKMKFFPNLILISYTLQVKALSHSQPTVKSILGAGTNTEISELEIRLIDSNLS